MPANLEALRATNAYRARLLAIRQQTIRAAALQWRGLDFADLDASFARWQQATALVTAGAQGAAAGLASAYLTHYLRASLGARAHPAPAIDTAAYAGRSRDGRPLAEALRAPLYTVKIALGQGNAPAAAASIGFARAQRTVAAETMAASRGALSDGIREDDRVVGWRRAVDGGACGACLGSATGAIFPDEDVPEVHDYCRCLAEPVVRGVRERTPRQTGPELWAAMTPAAQDALFAGRGGKDKADLIRSGAASLEDLVHRSPMATRRDDITEAPLEALTN